MITQGNSNPQQSQNLGLMRVSHHKDCQKSFRIIQEIWENVKNFNDFKEKLKSLIMRLYNTRSITYFYI